jgi:hypothetical protein
MGLGRIGSGAVTLSPAACLVRFARRRKAHRFISVPNFSVTFSLSTLSVLANFGKIGPVLIRQIAGRFMIG